MSFSDKDWERLEELESKAAPPPWSLDYMYGALRHIHRNVYLEEFCDPSEVKDDEHMPGRYDGTFLGELRNMLPGILARLEAAEKVCDVAESGADEIKLFGVLDAWRKAKGEDGK